MDINIFCYALAGFFVCFFMMGFCTCMYELRLYLREKRRILIRKRHDEVSDDHI